MTIGDYKQHYTPYWLLCAPAGSTFRSSVLIARTINEFCIRPSTDRWGRFMPRRKVGNTGTKHVCGYADCYLSFKGRVVSLKERHRISVYNLCHFERSNSVTSQPLAAGTSSRCTGFDPGLSLTVTCLSLSTSAFPYQYHSTNDPYSSSSFF